MNNANDIFQSFVHLFTYSSSARLRWIGEELSYEERMIITFVTSSTAKVVFAYFSTKKPIVRIDPLKKVHITDE
jgi:hypothetical protein